MPRIRGGSFAVAQERMWWSRERRRVKLARVAASRAGTKIQSKESQADCPLLQKSVQTQRPRTRSAFEEA